MAKKIRSPVLSMIVAMDENRGIGYKDKIPWDIPEDRKWFKEKTLGHVVIMGRKTYESIIDFLGKPLPGRINVVLTRNKDYKAKGGSFVTYSIEDAVNLAKEKEKSDEIFIIGGGKVYEGFLPLADRIYLTKVEGNFEADVFFPELEGFKEVFKEEHKNRKYSYSFVILEKKV